MGVSPPSGCPKPSSMVVHYGESRINRDTIIQSMASTHSLEKPSAFNQWPAMLKNPYVNKLENRWSTMINAIPLLTFINNISYTSINSRFLAPHQLWAPYWRDQSLSHPSCPRDRLSKLNSQRSENLASIRFTRGAMEPRFGHGRDGDAKKARWSFLWGW